MSDNQKYFNITTPIYYVNDKPHIGHAYTSIATDVLARWKRLDGYQVRFLTGTDEHGQKVEKSAVDKGLTPQEFTDAVSQTFRDLTQALNLSNDDFIRTTEPRHIVAAQAIWKKLLDKGDIYLGSYAGWYSVRDEAFYGEGELVDGKAPTGAPVEWVEEPSYFFKLSQYQDKLLAFYEENKDFIAPEARRNEVLRFVEGGLTDLSVSRTTFAWGIPVPQDEKHVMYVWLDALVNYITALGYPDETSNTFRHFWPNTMHMVGKDILRFHTVYWPAFLMSADLPLPKRVFAHGWWTNEGEKISKSLGNVIDPHALISVYGLDQTRYFMMREVPFGGDGNFSRLAMVGRINSELANTIGNLMQRTLSLVVKNCESVIPAAPDANLSDASSLIYNIRKYMESQAFHLALEEIVQVARDANEKIDREAPWSLKKEGTPESLAKMNRVLYELVEDIRRIALLLQPFTPDAAANMLTQLMIPENERSLEHILKPIASGVTIGKPEGVFPRFNVDE